MSADTDLLDLVVLSRGEKVVFDLVDAQLNKVGDLHPAEYVTVQNDSTQGIKRRLTNVHIAPNEYASVNPLVHRIRPYWQLSTGTKYPLGVFLFADASTKRYSYGNGLDATLLDQGLILGQQLSTNIGFPADTAATTAIAAVIQAAGIFAFNVAASTYTFGAPQAWPAGKSHTTYAKVLSDICALAGYYDPYFDNTGTLQVKQAVTVSQITPTLKYLDGGRIISGTITESNNLLKAPNQFLVLDTSATTGDISYLYRIPATAPHSYENRGFFVTDTIEAPGVGTVAQAQSVASTFYNSNPQAYATAVWQSPADPRHDTYDVVNYRGANYLETQWALTCAPGGPMTHTAVRIYP